jgi:Rieske Fe-S protein
MGSDGGAREYCLTSSVQVLVPGGVHLKVGEALLVNANDNTAVILARDADGLYARSGICTHACCIVAICGDSSCRKLTPSPVACAPTEIVRPSATGGIVCPCHGSMFRLSDGTPTKGPARLPLPSYAAMPDGNDVWVDTGTIVDPTARS